MCVHACLVFMGWQAILEQGVQHGDKWDRIERVPARPYKLDPASWKKGPREMLLIKEVPPTPSSRTLVAPIFSALIASRRHSPSPECKHDQLSLLSHLHTHTQ